MKVFILLFVITGMVLGCGITPTPTVVPIPTVPRSPTIVAPNGFRPLQEGDEVEGAAISYQYLLPTLEQPAVNLAFGTNLLQLIMVKPDLSDSLVEYAREMIKSPVPVLAYEEANPNQTEPSAVTFDGTKPIEIVFIQLVPGTHYWSVTETDDKGVQAAYKLVRRKDGGLRFIDAYGLIALHSFENIFTLNGGGTGLVFSSRLALLKLILTNEKYQRGTNIFATSPVDLSAFDSRILKIDPTRTGLAQDRDWVLVSRPGPNPGLQGQ